MYGKRDAVFSCNKNGSNIKKKTSLVIREGIRRVVVE